MGDNEGDGRLSGGHSLVGIPLPGLQLMETEASRAPRPDSWFGSNGTALPRILSTGTRGLATGPRESFQVREGSQTGNDQSHAVVTSGATGLVPEVIIGADDRQRIADTSALPYRWICDLSITDATGLEWLGTGWLASRRLVITAGHCVYLTNQGGWARRITVAPGRDGADQPYTFDALSCYLPRSQDLT